MSESRVSNTTHEIFSVSELNSTTRELIEGSFPLIWVEGEISNLARPGSGHLYFTLKDTDAQVRCAMFRMKNRLVKFNPQNGNQILIRAKVSFYETRGEFQLIAEHMELAGDGLLRQRFEALKNKLDAEGLFDSEAKFPIPAFPRQIGLITSPSGAAIRDILSVLARRFPALPVVIYPVAVQGDGATKQIVAAIQTANKDKRCDILILSRGGGSIEDLWCFNEESVARAMSNSTVPIVTGIGHEIDFTIADFVADQRAPTPSVAAEIVSPNREEWQEITKRHASRLKTALHNILQRHQTTLTNLLQRLQHPRQRLNQSAQRIDELETRLINSQQTQFKLVRAQLQNITTKLQQQSPAQRIKLASQQLKSLTQSLHNQTKHQLKSKQQALRAVGRALNTISPLATLERGYTIVNLADKTEAKTNAKKSNKQQTIVRRKSQLEKGDRINIRFTDGTISSKVESINNN